MKRFIKKLSPNSHSYLSIFITYITCLFMWSIFYWSGGLFGQVKPEIKVIINLGTALCLIGLNISLIFSYLGNKKILMLVATVIMSVICIFWLGYHFFYQWPLILSVLKG